jgi:hypothetical protein
LDSVFGVGIDSDFGFLNMKIRNLGAGLNWENFSSGNKIILIPRMKIDLMLRKKKKKKKKEKEKKKENKRKENWFDEKTGRLFDENTHTLASLLSDLVCCGIWTMADSSGGLFKEDPVRSLARRKMSLLSIAFLLLIRSSIFMFIVFDDFK